jgi:hypothetical protein
MTQNNMKENQADMQESSSIIRKHIDRWKSAYDLLGHFFVFLAVVVGLIGLLISWNAVQQTRRSIDLTQEALKISQDALQIQKDEYYLRNRPFILIRDVKFSGPVTMPSGNHYDHSVFFLMTNGSSIPANSMIIEAKVFIKDKEIRKTVFGPKSLSSDIGLTALPPDSHTSGTIGLTKKEFEESKLLKTMFRVKIEISYNGILGTTEDKYHTSYTVIYKAEESKFKMMESKYN